MAKPFIIILLFQIILCQTSVKEIKKRMQSLYGENKEIKDDKYDKSLSVPCNNGIFVGKKEENVISFKGIPYAKPPINDLRWKDPVLAEDDTKVYEAFYFGKASIQTEFSIQYGSYYPQSEDCLYLNIWKNNQDTSTNKAVIVFIHGGSYGWGGTSDPLYNGYNLVKKYPDIIFVTIGYRLGIFGFIDFSSVTGGENFKTSTNLGLLDQICALKWIQKNIENFGGDPTKVTVMGQSSGAGSISLLPLIDDSNGLFKRMILESGSFSLTFSTDEAKVLTNKLLKESGAKSMDDLVKLSEEELIKINSEIDDYANYAIRDKNTFSTDLYEAYKSGKAKDIDILLGSNADEVKYWMKTFSSYSDYLSSISYYLDYLPGEFVVRYGIIILYENDLKKMENEDKEYAEEFLKLVDGKKYEKIIEFYNEMIFRLPLTKIADYHSESGGNTYFYHWKIPGESKKLGASHNIELSYTLNNLNETNFIGKKVYNEFAEKVQDMWTNFAKTGNPSTSEITWDKYDSDKRKVIILDEKIEMTEDLKDEQREILDPLLKYYINGNFAQISFNVPETYKIAAGLIGVLIILIFIISRFKH